jgi:hypothetical protein
MKIIFYSDQCKFSKKLLDYINKNNLTYLFKLINIDNTKNIPNNIDSVPTIVDTDLNQYLKSKKAFEYIINIKYFNNPTNNIEFIKNIPTNPLIIEDNKAYKEIINSELELNMETDNNIINIELNNNIENKPLLNNNNNNKLSTFLKKNRY